MANTATTENTHSRLFEKYRSRYERGGCTKEQLRRLVELGAITAEEYTEITREEYE
jgi:uncharacterized XkdX family phage protein